MVFHIMNLKFNVPSGQIKRIAENMSWLLRGLASFSKCSFFEFDENFINFINNLAERVLYGVPSEVLNLIRINIPVIHRTRAITLYQAGFTDIESLINTSIDELKINGISERVAIRIKSDIENLILNENDRRYQSQIREALEVGLDVNLIHRLYNEEGDDFVKVFIEILNDHFDILAYYVGDTRPHDVDGVINLEEGNIVIEGKRQKKDRIGPIEAEEVWGKGQRHEPIAYVTIGYPDFSTGSIENVPNTKITLLPHYVIGKFLIDFYEDKITRENIINALLSGEYLGYRKITKLTII